eukprot:TRINITY_DN7793_c0_g1_i1.p1 TRINITY_DN7793_c0_g1~~TRINITY_DN7793_c0_g1_i1.p1  ORF type:complete len:469 (+),score=79.24 TRINITY_DN7793_c0_g1_i1:50-1456(+)
MATQTTKSQGIFRKALPVVVALFGLITALLFAPFNILSTKNLAEDTSQPDLNIGLEYPFIVGEVKRIKVTPDEHFTNRIASLNEPVILTNTAVEKWPARKLWTPSYISRFIPQFNDVQQHENKTFLYYHATKPMAPFDVEYKNSQTWKKVNLTSKEFLQKIQVTPPYHYFAGQLQSLGDSLEIDVDPIEPLMVKDDYFSYENSHQHRWSNVWFGAAGSTTQAHFDVYHNFYAQIYGRKRFILFAPSEHENLYIYPFLHPAALQSQVNFDAPDYDVFPNFKRAKGFQAVLGPGDVLYIPPLYFHHVTAVDTSISVSIWTKFPEAKSVQSTWQGSMPFRASWSKSTLNFALRKFLQVMLDEIVGQGQAVHFIKRLLGIRYDPLILRVPSLMNATASFCVVDFPEEERRTITEDQETLRDFEAKISEWKKIFAKVEPSRKEIWLQHLCEQIAFSIVGVANVAKFFGDFVNC